MASPSLVSYVKQQLQAGYSAEQLKGYLIQYHYAPAQIDAALREAQKVPEENRRFSRQNMAVLGAVAVSILLLGSFFIFSGVGDPDVSFELNVALPTSSIEQGDPLRVQFGIETSEDEIPLDVRYELLTLQDAVVLSKRERITVNGGFSGEKTLELQSSIDPGSYYVRVSGTYNGKKESATASFTINKREAVAAQFVEEKRCPGRCDDNNKCTRDYCGPETDFGCTHEVLDPCCGDGICASSESYPDCLSDCDAPANVEGEEVFRGTSIFERIDIIGDISKRDYDAALEHCGAIEIASYQFTCYGAVASGSGNMEACELVDDERGKDDCYFEFGKSQLDKGACPKIKRESRRDQCYMEFVTKQDYTVCPFIQDRWLKQSCNSMKELAAFSLQGLEIPELNLTELGITVDPS